MKSTITIYSEKKGEIKKFLEHYYSKNFELYNILSFKIDFDSPVDMIDIISCFIDNCDKYNINIWISLDKDVYICVTENNLNSLIKYIYERYPY